MGVFTHFWFWHPLQLFVNRAFTRTAAIGLNSELKMPKWRFRSGAPPSAFAYPPPTTNEKKEEKALAPSAVLSTSAKAGKRPAKALGDDAMEVEKEKEKEAELAKSQQAKEAEEARVARDAMLKTIGELHERGSIPNELHGRLTTVPETEFPPLPEKGESADDVKKPKLAALLEQLTSAHAAGLIGTAALGKITRHKPKKDGDDEAEPEFEVLENPARVLRAQERAVSLLPDSRYVPVAPGRQSGIIMLKDMQHDEPEELLPESAAPAPGQAADEEEPSPPAPFEFTE